MTERSAALSAPRAQAGSGGVPFHGFRFPRPLLWLRHAHWKLE